MPDPDAPACTVAGCWLSDRLDDLPHPTRESLRAVAPNCPDAVLDRAAELVPHLIAQWRRTLHPSHTPETPKENDHG